MNHDDAGLPRASSRARSSDRARAVLLLLVVPVVALATSCSGSDEGDGLPESAPLTAEATPTSAPAREPEPSTPAEPTAAPTPTAEGAESPGGGGFSEPMSVPGTVSARRGDCLYFTAGDMAQSWVLVGKTSGLRPGDQVEVDGRLSNTPDPACEDAVPFTVTSFRRL